VSNVSSSAFPYANDDFSGSCNGIEKKGLSRFDADKRKNAINELESGVDSPTDLGPTCLIACPASVRNNWEREFQTVRLTPSLSPLQSPELHH
jgi:hypothetical protein